MLLLYRRGTKECRLETSYDESTRQYTLVIHRDPHERQIEKFRDAIAFDRRLKRLGDDFAAEGWEQT